MHLVYEAYDPHTGFTDQVFYEECADGKGKIHIKRLQDVEHILKMNQVMRAERGHKANYKDSNGLHLAARIPNIVIEQWMREGFNWYTSTDAERRKKLNDPDYRKLLVRDGKL